MKNVLPSALPLAAISVLSWSCNADLLVGEKDCYGEGIDCDSDAPTLHAIDAIFAGSVRGSMFDVEASRTVAPTWIYEDPKFRPAQLVRAPGGGIWAHYFALPTELTRIDAEGEPVESHPMDTFGALSTDEALRPVVVSAQNGLLTRTTLGPEGEIAAWPIGPVAPKQGWPTLLAGPDGRVRVALFAEAGSYVAEYDGAGDLIWKQPQIRDARHFPFDREPLAAPPAYRMIGLSDGSIAVGVPKDTRSDRTPGLIQPEKGHGITLLESNGNLRWDLIVDDVSSTMFLAPGLDGSVVYADAPHAGSSFLNPTGTMHVLLIDRDGKLTTSWGGQRTGYHDVVPRALCTDAAGMIYVALLSGERDAPMPTVCRMNPEDPGEVVCLGVEGVLRPVPDALGPGFATHSSLGFAIHTIAALEPGAVVLSTSQGGYEIPRADVSAPPIARMVRIDF